MLEGPGQIPALVKHDEDRNWWAQRKSAIHRLWSCQILTILDVGHVALLPVCDSLNCQTSLAKSGLVNSVVGIPQVKSNPPNSRLRIDEQFAISDFSN